MRWGGYRQVKFSSVVMDLADVKRRAKASHVADLAQNIRDHGDEPIHAPTIRMPGKTLLCGRDRMAALLTLKAKKLWVRLCECTEEEAADLEASENVHRRTDSRGDVLARAVAAKEALLVAKDRDKCPDSPAASPKQIKVEARKQVARDAGMSPAALKKTVLRSKERAEEAAAPPEAEPEFVPSLRLLGVPVEEAKASCHLAASQQEAIDEADRYLRLAMGALKRIEMSDVGQELRRQVERVGSLVRSHRAESICPWCKHIPALVGSCNGCKAIGYVSAEAAMRAPSELFFDNPPLVVVAGEFVPYAEALAGKNAKGGYVGGVCGKCGKPNGTSDRRPCEKCLGGSNRGKSISVQTTDGKVLSGNELTLERDEEEDLVF